VKQNLRAWGLFPRPEVLLGPAGMRPDWLCGDADSIHGETKAAATPGAVNGLAERAIKAQPRLFRDPFGNL
jgi:hypothetical protein